MTCSLFLVFATLVAFLQPTQRPAKEAASAPFDQTHALWSEVLKKHVVADHFDYAALAKDRATFDRYLAALHGVKADELGRWTREQQFAFWINAYNAHVVDLVTRNYPVDSIKDIGSLFTSVWKKAFIDMPALHPSGKSAKLSLEDIEHAILRPKFKDARVHAAINCASASCPALRNEAFTAERLNEQLDEQVKLWLADATRNRFDKSKSRIDLSQIFDWFKDDFVRDAGSVREWIARYAPPAEAEWLRGAGKALEIKYLDYSWKLNGLEKPEK